MPIRPENRSRYPADWPQISKRIRFDRARSRCECDGRCGRGCTSAPGARRCPYFRGDLLASGALVVLTVAHLDHTPENCDDTNLMAMCQACHLNYDRDHHAQTASTTRHTAALAAGHGVLDLGVAS